MGKISKILVLLCFLLEAYAEPTFAEPKSEKESVPTCAVNLGKPMTEIDAEAQSVIDVLRAITKALADHDFKAMAAHMDQNCTTYDETTKKLVAGRDAIISDVEAKVKAEEDRLKAPPINFSVDRPYVRVRRSAPCQV